jgi:hypothetical protein
VALLIKAANSDNEQLESHTPSIERVMFHTFGDTNVYTENYTVMLFLMY